MKIRDNAAYDCHILSHSYYIIIAEKSIKTVKHIKESGIEVCPH